MLLFLAFARFPNSAVDLADCVKSALSTERGH